MRRQLLVFLVVVLVADAVTHAQTAMAPDQAGASAYGNVAALASHAAQASSRFTDQRVAITEGYHKVGPDFPGMGEHWVNFGRLLGDMIDPARPPILTYLPVDGVPVFTGIAFAKPVAQGSHPDGVPFPELWHFHSGTIDEETLFLNPASMPHRHTSGPRLAMMHLWVGIENPAGPAQHDNWALPFLRLGVKPPASVPPKAGKALFLLAGGVDYYERLIGTLSDLTDYEVRKVRNVLLDSRLAAGRAVADCLAGDEVTPAHLEALSGIWDELWVGIRMEIRETEWSRVAMLSG